MPRATKLDPHFIVRELMEVQRKRDKCAKNGETHRAELLTDCMEALALAQDKWLEARGRTV